VGENESQSHDLGNLLCILRDIYGPSAERKLAAEKSPIEKVRGERNKTKVRERNYICKPK